MAAGKQETEWWHTAVLVTTVINIVSKKKVRPEDVHPMLQKERERINSVRG